MEPSMQATGLMSPPFSEVKVGKCSITGEYTTLHGRDSQNRKFMVFRVCEEEKENRKVPVVKTNKEGLFKTSEVTTFYLGTCDGSVHSNEFKDLLNKNLILILAEKVGNTNSCALLYFDGFQTNTAKVNSKSKFICPRERSDFEQYNSKWGGFTA